MQRRKGFAACLLLLGLLLPACLSAQIQPDRSVGDRRSRLLFIRGQVRSVETEMTIDLVRVSLERMQGGVVQQKFSDSNGNFEFMGVPAGSYRILASRDGYEDAVQDVELTIMSRPSVQVYMQPERRATHSASESSISAQDFAVPKKARKEYDKAIDFLEKRDFDRSVLHLHKAIEIYPEYYQAYTSLGVAYLDMKNYDAARSSLLKAIELNDKHALAYFALGGLYNHQQEFQQAQEILLRGTAIDGRAWQGHFELGKTYWGMGNYVKAEEHAVRAREIYDGFPSLHLLLANIYLRKRALPEALVALDAFLKLEPNNAISGEVRQAAEKLRTNLAPTKKQ